MTNGEPAPSAEGSTAVTPPAAAHGRRPLLRGAAIDFGPLRAHRDFRLLYAGQMVSYFGNMLTTVALLFQVYALTHSSLAVGLLGAVQFVPLLLFAFVGGALADAVDRRRMVQLTELALAGCSAALMLNALLPAPRVWLLYVVGALAAGLDSLQRPSLGALLPRVVAREELVTAVALTKLQQSIGQIVGPAAAGLLIASVGLPSAFGIDVATFVASLLALRLMRAVPPPLDAERPSPRRAIEGLRYVRASPVLLGTFLVDLTATFFGWPYALFPALAVAFTRHAGDVPAATALGLLYAAPAVGALSASIASGWTRRVHRHGLGVLVAVTVWGLAVAGIGLAPSLPIALACLGVVGGANLISSIFRGAIANQAVPDALRGRLAGIELISYTSGPLLGDLEGGTVATVFTPRIAVLAGGVLCVLGVSVLALALPRLRRYDSRIQAAANPPIMPMTPPASAASSAGTRRRSRK